ncbi:flavodoxin domain-containing protein [Blattabacterium cuenoti]|uniref:sulfite reductase flavoprotein subunit alpha n=1 Tax=Blattabacterium cuenoti TaxID=1653831 RepID=UPI00163CAA61|nr:sulfite reductase flavoprotein subunit alpha [Blattabacterium cuenoti]
MKQYHGIVVKNKLISNFNKDIHHVEILISSKDNKYINYIPGDSIAILAENPLYEVYKIINLMHKFNNTLFVNQYNKQKIVNILKKNVNIFCLSKKMLERYSMLVKKSIDNNRIWNFIELINEYPIVINQYIIDNLFKIMDPIKPRLYSISSYPKIHNLKIHITVSRNNFITKPNGKIQYGLCSNFISKLKYGESVYFYICKNLIFKLPKSNKDIIFIGTGTGIAPFRSFLYEREFINAPGKNWLFFGNQSIQKDFLYQEEIYRWKKKGILNRLSLAFSRDQKKKVYIHHKIWDNRIEFFHWINQGAYIFVCGKKDPMSIEVENIISMIIKTVGMISSDQSYQFIRRMKLEKRYLKSVY